MYIPPHADSIALCAALHARADRVALNVELDIANGAPEWVELIPAGPFVVGRDGRRWLFDQPDAVIRNSMLGADLPLDWEHSTELKAKDGEPAPAAAWIASLENRAGALWGRLSWTDRGRASVASREYRYLSPVFIYEKATQRISRMTSAGLTNSPNLQLPALNRQEDPPMKFSQLILAALALAADSTEEQVLTAINAMKSDRDIALNRANNPPAPALDKFVPRADFDVALNRATTAEQKLGEVQQRAKDAEIETEIGAALKAGKITPATAEYHKAQCRAEGGLERFREFVKAAPAVADPSKIDGQQPGAAAGVAFNAEEKKVAAMFGNSEEDMKKYGKTG